VSKPSKSKKGAERLVKPRVMTWLRWAQQIQAIAQNGLAYAKDPFDKERYEQLRKLACEIMAKYTKLDVAVIHELFAHETGYATPKVDIRAAIFRSGKVLLVKEKATCRSCPPLFANVASVLCWEGKPK
jgi:hypothetical protein